MTQGGYMGKLLEVDLTRRKIAAITLPESVLQTWLGGAGLGLHLLSQEMTPDMKPTDPVAPVFIMSGPLTGTLAPSSSNWTIVTLHSSIHYMPAIAHAHGDWGARLKHAGWDGIIIRGASPSPVFLWIDNDRVEFRDASRYWGLDTYETQRRIRLDLQDVERVSVACIGPAGENLLLGANVRNDLAWGCNKGSPGLVWGAKKLKAIAVRGSGSVPIAQYAAFVEACEKWRNASKQSERISAGEARGIKIMPRIGRMGGIPAYNFTSCQWGVSWADRFEKDMAQWKVLPKGSWQCDARCHHETLITTGPFAGTTAFGFGAENIEGAATIIGVEDPGTCLAMANFYDAMGACPSEPGHAIAMAFELYNKGLLSKAETGGLELTWGNHEAAMELFNRMLRREGIGATLAKGLKEAARELGRGAEEMIAHIKGAGSNDHDLRGWGIGIQFGSIISGAGPTWQGFGAEWIPEPDLGYAELQNPFTVQGKGEAVFRTQVKKMWDDCTGCCLFTLISIPGILDMVPRTIALATGWDDVNREFALTLGERIVNLQRLMALHRGYTPECDYDFSRRLVEPAPDGPAKGQGLGPHFERLRTEYYNCAGWDRDTGKPRPEVLVRLGLADYPLGARW